MKTSVIKPGILISLKSTVVGGVQYQREDLGKKLDDGEELTEWKTVRVIQDKEEHERATKCRSAALALVRKTCSSTTFGLLCPTDNEGALDTAIAAARKLVDEHNESAAHTKVGVYVLKGRVASDDAEAMRAITQEAAQLVKEMDAGVKNFDASAIRAAADRARELSNMLGDEQREKIEGAIAQARTAARTIVKRVEKEGEDRAIVMMDIQRGQIESARIAFLDLSGESNAPKAEPSPAVDVQRFADIGADA